MTVANLVKLYNPSEEPETAPEASREAVDALGDPPAHILAPEGLPHQRAAMARHIAWRDAIASEVELLEAGRRDLADHINKLERARAAPQERRDDAAAGVLERIRRGAAWSISTPSTASPSDGELEIAFAALQQLDEELSAKRAMIEAISERVVKLARAAIREEGRAIEAAYERNVKKMREQLAQLVALRRLTGGGFSDRMILELPAFTGRHERQPLRIEEADISAARTVWADQMEAWASDPSAEPRLVFPRHDPSKAESIVYHEKSALERQIADERFASHERA